MKRSLRCLALSLLLAGGLTSGGSADEGMWLLNAPPRERLRRDYGFELTQGWLDHAMRSSVRFNNGGSGAFVSRDGLVVTNHHIGSDSLQKLSRPGHDLVKEGFYAPTLDKELRCPDLELNALQSIEDVTQRVESVVKSEMTVEEASAARRAAMSTLEKEEAQRTGLRCDIVTLYQGGAYHLYRYKKFTDVRLVMAPHYDAAFFGGDHDNFEFPRYNFDVCFFRVYENGQPLASNDFLRWNSEGVKEGDLVFVVGHPGRTNRLDTYARLLHLRDLSLPFRIEVLSDQHATLEKFARQGVEQARQAQHDLYSIANGLKAYRGQYQGLLDSALLARKKSLEDGLRAKVAASPEWSKKAGGAWSAVEQAELRLAEFEKEYLLLEGRSALHSQLFGLARHIVRQSEERTQPNANRLREYRDSNRASLELELFSPAGISPELEKAKLTASLTLARKVLGESSPVMSLLLDGREPAARAAQLVDGSRLFDVAERKRLAALSPAELARSQDAMIQLALALDKPSRELRHRAEVEVEEPERQAYAQIARSQFALEDSFAPDATFTLRLAYGKVASYQDESGAVPYFTTVDGMLKVAQEHGNRDPYHLPQAWLDKAGQLTRGIGFNFVSTADTIGGNSGSPVINRKGEVVGVNFDRNRFGLVRNFIYSEKQARHIAVHSPAVVEVVEKIYNCPALVRELQDGHR